MLQRSNRDYESVLNAYSILAELTEYERTFLILVSEQFQDSLIFAACDISNSNQAYAIHLFSSYVRAATKFQG